jgi:alkanesulfonate monooxygenase SsuD/methylene tetrahydromethanopterin reductase-like flavin-dependent oxidoreductase (luciferase family)
VTPGEALFDRSAPHFGVNLNNREPLLAPGYDLGALLALGEFVDDADFDAVFVGDSLFSKPRFEALTLLGALTQRTSRVRLGTSALVASLRDPLYLAVQWATLDHLSQGRMILGAGAGNAEPRVKQEFASLGLDFSNRMSRLEECLHVLRELWATGSVQFHGAHFRYDDVAFFSGTEQAPFTAFQKTPPIWVVSNPNIMRPAGDAQLANACRRILTYGDGWLTCCRAAHPEELERQLELLNTTASSLEVDFAAFEVAYQVAMTLADTREEAHAMQTEYISSYYPELRDHVELSNWGPVGTPDDIIEWLRRFAAIGTTTFICRFGAIDQFEQVRHFRDSVLPAFRTVPPRTASTRRSGVVRP